MRGRCAHEVARRSIVKRRRPLSEARARARFEGYQGRARIKRLREETSPWIESGSPPKSATELQSKLPWTESTTLSGQDEGRDRRFSMPDSETNGKQDQPQGGPPIASYHSAQTQNRGPLKFLRTFLTGKPLRRLASRAAFVNSTRPNTKPRDLFNSISKLH